MEDIEKQFITSCLSTLTQEGKEICKEVSVMIGEKDEMMMEKARVFCDFFLSHTPDGVETTKLERRCKKYIEDLGNFNHYKHTFERNTKERERLFNMGGMRLKNL